MIWFNLFFKEYEVIVEKRPLQRQIDNTHFIDEALGFFYGATHDVIFLLGAIVKLNK